VELTEGGPSTSSDDRLLALFHQDPIEAGQRLTRLRSRIIQLLRAKSCRNAEDIWATTVLIVLQKSLMPGDIGNLEGFFWRIAFRTYLSQRHRARSGQPLEEMAGDALAVRPRMRDHAFFGHLRACLMELSQAERALIAAESFGEDREEIARRLRLTRGALRRRLHGIRTRLYECLQRRGITLNIEAGNI
jgi:DNA-directed RNA polymerase specialized sigma24 family protein